MLHGLGNTVFMITVITANIGSQALDSVCIESFPGICIFKALSN